MLLGGCKVAEQQQQKMFGLSLPEAINFLVQIVSLSGEKRSQTIISWRVRGVKEVGTSGVTTLFRNVIMNKRIQEPDRCWTKRH